jgi:hypothetical protein
LQCKNLNLVPPIPVVIHARLNARYLAQENNMRMRELLLTAAGVTLLGGFAATANAAPVVGGMDGVKASASEQASVDKVQYRRGYRVYRGYGRRHYRGYGVGYYPYAYDPYYYAPYYGDGYGFYYGGGGGRGFRGRGFGGHRGHR